MRCRRVGSCRAFQKSPQEELPERAFGKGYMTLHPYIKLDVRTISECVVIQAKAIGVYEDRSHFPSTLL
jgi:hypothetical protein